MYYFWWGCRGNWSLLRVKGVNRRVLMRPKKAQLNLPFTQDKDKMLKCTRNFLSISNRWASPVRPTMAIFCSLIHPLYVLAIRRKCWKDAHWKSLEGCSLEGEKRTRVPHRNKKPFFFGPGNQAFDLQFCAFSQTPRIHRIQKRSSPHLGRSVFLWSLGHRGTCTRHAGPGK